MKLSHLKNIIREQLRQLQENKQLLTEASYSCAYDVAYGPVAGTCSTTFCGDDPNGNNPEIECDCDCDNYSATTCCPNANVVPGGPTLIHTKNVIGGDGRTTTSIAQKRI